MFAFLIAYFILSLVIGSAASQRGRNAFGWFLLSMLTTPLLAGVFLLLFPSLRDPAIERLSVDDEALQQSIRKGRKYSSADQLPEVVGSVRWGVLVVVVIGAVVLLKLNGSENDPSKTSTESAPTAGGYTPSPVASSPAAASQPFVVAIKTTVSGGARPIVKGTTNLPDGTHLSIWLKQPWLPNAKERMSIGLCAVGDDCPFPLVATQTGTKKGLDEVVVKNGQFNEGPFTDKGAALSPGTYVLEVSLTFAADQPADVLAIIGPLGENMTGPLVGGCCFGPGWDQAEIQKSMDKTREAAPILGASIYYARYVEIGQPKQSNAQSATPSLRTASRPEAQIGSAATKAFSDCLLSRGRTGSYTSSDGMSANRLIDDCEAQFDTWHTECIAYGGTEDGAHNCTMRAAFMARNALKLLGK
jgi:hypothetical protein